MSDPRVQLVLCTVPDREVGQRIARELVEARLAACVNVLPGIHSTYRWQGAVESGNEALLLIKTTSDRFEALRDWIVANHSYELPEVIAVDVAAGLAAYLDWVVAGTRD
jgi:periplasmic divalent cation tolerance protein